LQSNPPDVGGAQGNPSDVGGTARTTTTAKAAHHKKAAGHSVKGTVASVDATAKGFVVHPAKGEDVTLKVNDKTRYPKGKTWDDVKADAKVTVSYHSDGTDNWALTVKFAAEPKAKAEKPPSNPSDVGGTARTTGTG
jgi:hypothetical protein